LFSQSYNIGTFNVNDRVTFGGAFFTVEEVRFNQPAGNLIAISATGLTGCPTTTTTSTTTSTTTTTTAAPVFTYLRYDVDGNCGTFNPIPFFSYNNYGNGFYYLNGEGTLRYLSSSAHSNFTNQINSVTGGSCATTTTTTTTTAAPTTTTTTTAAPTTTTTTTAAPNCQFYFLQNNDEYSDYYDFQSCDGTWNYNVELQGNGGSLTICARIGTVTAGGAITITGPQGSCN
jgi:hypothetical protein